MEKSFELKIESLRCDCHDMTFQRDIALDNLRKQADVVTRLENEAIQIRNALGLQSMQHDKQSIETVGQLSGEIEILHRRLKEAVDSKVCVSN